MRRGALLTVTSYTKQTAAWERLYNSILSQVGEYGLVKFFGGTTDAFGAAQNTMLEVLKQVDAVAADAPPDTTHYTSAKVPDLTLDTSQPFRQLRLMLCRMHNIERVLRHFLFALLGEQGIENEAVSAQLVYLCWYITHKLTAFVDVVNLIAVDRDISKWKDLPALARCIVSKMAQQRWISMERTCMEICELMDVPASPALILFVQEMLGEATWVSIQPLLRCFTTQNTSHYALTMLILANHTTKECSALCWRALAFLTAPAHRIAVFLAAGFFGLHQRYAAFCDGKPRTHVSSVCSTRALELAQFEQTFLEEMNNLRLNWQSAMPNSHSFLVQESERAVDLHFATSPTQYVSKYDKIMRDSAEAAYESAKTYFYDPLLSPGHSILHLCCANTAPHCAAVLLELLRADGLVPAAVTGPAPQHSRPDPEDRQLFPHATAAAFRKVLKENLSNAAVRSVVFKAYGLGCSSVISELLQIEQQVYTGSAGWEFLTNKCPALHETLLYHFAATSITGTMAEQAFCVAHNLKRINSAECTRVDSLQHFLTVRNAALDKCNALVKEKNSTHTEPLSEESEHNSEPAAVPQAQARASLGRKRKPKSRVFRSKDSRVSYCLALREYAQQLKARQPTVRSVKAIRGMGKKLTALSTNATDIEAAMHGNFVRKRRRFGGDLLQFARDHDEAKLTDAKKLCVRASPAELAAARRKQESEVNAQSVLHAEYQASGSWKRLTVLVLKSAAVVLLPPHLHVPASAKKQSVVDALEQALPTHLATFTPPEREGNEDCSDSADEEEESEDEREVHCDGDNEDSDQGDWSDECDDCSDSCLC